jgi:hypothetical protein
MAEKQSSSSNDHRPSSSWADSVDKLLDDESFCRAIEAAMSESSTAAAAVAAATGELF